LVILYVLCGVEKSTLKHIGWPVGTQVLIFLLETAFPPSIYDFDSLSQNVFYNFGVLLFSLSLSDMQLCIAYLHSVAFSYVLFKFYKMGSSKPSSPPYLFMFTPFFFIFISIQTASCVGNAQYVNCNRPFLCATSETPNPIYIAVHCATAAIGGAITIVGWVTMRSGFSPFSFYSFCYVFVVCCCWIMRLDFLRTFV
jgi:hypothetical protein